MLNEPLPPTMAALAEPLAVGCKVGATQTMSSGSKQSTTGGAMVMLNDFEHAIQGGVAVTIKFGASAVVGVPEINPAELSVSPAGKEPLASVNVYAPGPAATN